MTREEEEKALNAAAAREISREMDALMFTAVSPPRPTVPIQELRTSPPSSPHMSISGRGGPGFGEESTRSPVMSPREPNYMRQRDRTLNVQAQAPAVPPPASDQEDSIPSAQSQSPVSDSRPMTSSNQPLPLPPTISLRGTSPAQSFTSVDSPYRTPSEFPLAPPPSFYNHPSASGSGTFSSGGTRTISAAAFKRQLRAPSSPAVDNIQPTLDTSPLVISKRGLPGSPRPSPRLGPSEGLGMQRISSAPSPNFPGSEGYPDPRNRSVSGMARPDSVAQPGDDDEYDYISAYVDDHSGSSPDTHR
jgi:hypothetical protein